MKKIFFALLLLLSVKSFGQIIADPALSQIAIKGINGFPMLPSNISMDSLVQLKVPIYNINMLNNLPSGTCKIKIGLGSKIELVPGFNLTTVNTSVYFKWTALFDGGQVQITGELIAPLPANFSDTATFTVRGKIPGNSTITTNFLITNHNTIVNLSDENPTNNNSFLPYTLVAGQGGPLPVTFTKVQATKEACNIRVNFDTENEINVYRFEIELSKDGVNFKKEGQLQANALIHYNFSIAITETNKASQVFIRIKSVDKDDKFQYSQTRKVSGTCTDTKRNLILFPNPAGAETNKLFVKITDGLFNGKYFVSILDISGKIISKKNVNLQNANQFDYEIKDLPAGQYILQIRNADGGQPESIKWQKY